MSTTLTTTIAAPRLIRAEDVALMAAMNIASVPVIRKPQVALIANGNELVMPGETPGPDQIIASNSFGIKALLESIGAHVRMLPIARDTEAAFINWGRAPIIVVNFIETILR